jgi:deoxyribonuclease IV
MRKIGAHVSTAGGLLNAVKNIQNIGGNCLQIFAGSPRTWKREIYSEEISTKFKQLINEHHLDPVFIHALYLVNLASDNPEILKNSFESLKNDLINGQKINSEGVIVHLGSTKGKSFDSVKDHLLNTIKKLLFETKDTPLIIENAASNRGKIGTISDLEFLSRHLPEARIKFCLDTAHLFASGFDLRQDSVIETLINTLNKANILNRLTLLHLNDSKASLDSGRDLHENIAEGQIGRKGLACFINHPKLRHLALILEVPGEDKNGPDRLNIDKTKAITGII